MKRILFLLLGIILLPSLMAQPRQVFYDDFEEYESLKMEAGNWTLVGQSQFSYSAFSGLTFYDYENANMPGMSFMVMDYSRINLAESKDVADVYQAHGGTKSMISTVPLTSSDGSTDASGYPADAWLISPKIDKLDGKGNIVSFYIRSNNDELYCPRFKVWIAAASSGDPVKMGEDNFLASRFTLLSQDPENLENYLRGETTSRWIKFVYSLDDFVGQEFHIAIQNISVAKREFYGLEEHLSMGFMIDDFEVVSDACLKEVKEVYSLGIKGEKATIKWTGDSDFYDIEYGAAGFQLGKGTREKVSSEEFTISGLDENQVYNYYVRAYCDESNASELWYGPYELKKIMSPVVITPEEPYSYGFESKDIENDGWKIETLVPAEGEWTHLPLGNSNKHKAYEGECYMLFAPLFKTEGKEAGSWIISRGMELAAHQEVVITFHMSAPYGKENFKACISRSNDAQSLKEGKVLFDAEDIFNGQFERFTVRFTPEEAGVYYVGFCVYSTRKATQCEFDYVTVQDASTYVGIENEEEDKESLLIYPNPAQDIITIVYPSYINTDVAQVIIRDMSGRQVKSETCQSFIHVSELSSGVYTITVNDGINKESKMFIKR